MGNSNSSFGGEKLLREWRAYRFGNHQDDIIFSHQFTDFSSILENWKFTTRFSMLAQITIRGGLMVGTSLNLSLHEYVLWLLDFGEWKVAWFRHSHNFWLLIERHRWLAFVLRSSSARHASMLHFKWRFRVFSGDWWYYLTQVSFWTITPWGNLQEVVLLCWPLQKSDNIIITSSIKNHNNKE